MSEKQFKIILSHEDETYEVDESSLQGNRVVSTQKKEFNLREQELSLLEVLLEAVKPKKSTELILKLDTQHRLEHTKHGKFVLFNQQEMDWFNEGLNNMLEQTTRGWVPCRMVLKQIIRPVEYEPEGEESKENPVEDTPSQD